jgi:hypothetical protein
MTTKISKIFRYTQSCCLFSFFNVYLHTVYVHVTYIILVLLEWVRARKVSHGSPTNVKQKEAKWLIIRSIGGQLTWKGIDKNKKPSYFRLKMF